MVVHAGVGIDLFFLLISAGGGVGVLLIGMVLEVVVAVALWWQHSCWC